MTRAPSKSVCMHRLCACTPRVRVRGDPTLDPTPASSSPGCGEFVCRLPLLRCLADHRFSQTALKLLFGRESPLEGLPPLSGPPTGDARRVAMLAHEPTQTRSAALMLEREAEVAALDATLDAAHDGGGRLIVVEGGAGIGKTRLLAEARELAAAAEFEVMTARGGELEGEFAFGIIRQLFEAPLAVRFGSHDRFGRRRGVLLRDAAQPLLARGELRVARPYAARRR